MKRLLAILILFLSFDNISHAEEIVQLPKDTASGYTKFFNAILLITASKHIRIKRTCKRNNIPKGQIEKRMSLQMPESKKKQLAHYTIENDGNLQELYNNLKKIYTNLKIV